jgi:hypothetical protein
MKKNDKRIDRVYSFFNAIRGNNTPNEYQSVLAVLKKVMVLQDCAQNEMDYDELYQLMESVATDFEIPNPFPEKESEGYTIKVTSEMSYLKPPIKINCTYAEFSIEDVSIKTGCMNWAANTGKGTMRGMEAPIVLSGMYPINWKEYSKVDDTNSGTFMYLVNTINK